MNRSAAGLRFTLLADGSSDRALVPILRWLLRQHCGNIPIQPDFADLRRLPKPPRGLVERIDTSIALYPCDLLFVHRDAETKTIPAREKEINVAVAKSREGGRLGGLQNPKQILHDLLARASELGGRRLKRFKRDLASRAHQVAKWIEDFGPLRQLPAFRRLERQVEDICRRGIPGVLD